MEKPITKNQKDKEALKDSKLEEQILKNLGNGTVEEKFEILLKKSIEHEKELKRLNVKVKQSEKNLETVLRDKDNLQKEYNKGVLIKDKLEQVCREQQKLIKSVQNESMAKIREEEEKRKENQAKFQQSINEINVTLTKNNDENNKLRDDNIEMAKKLKYLAEQYQAREQQLEKINEQINIESQLHLAKLKKVQVEATIEKEGILLEKQKLLDDLLNCKKIIKEMQTHESQLKEQVYLYSSKYDDFHNSLQKSNQIFTSYKEELEKMGKANKKLEKENFELKRKFERANATLIDLATEKQAKDDYVSKCTKQVLQLQKLLRTLQAERTQLHQLLKDHNIERPPVPVIQDESELTKMPPLPAEIIQKDKMELMQKNCTELKETLAKLQGQMNAITSKQLGGTGTEPNSKDSSNNISLNKKNKPKNKKGKTRQCPTAVKNNVEVKNQSYNEPANEKQNIETPNNQQLVSEMESEEPAAVDSNETTELSNVTENLENMEINSSETVDEKVFHTDCENVNMTTDVEITIDQ